jgi:hypothetical protein
VSGLPTCACCSRPTRARDLRLAARINRRTFGLDRVGLVCGECRKADLTLVSAHSGEPHWQSGVRGGVPGGFKTKAKDVEVAEPERELVGMELRDGQAFQVWRFASKLDDDPRFTGWRR